MTGQPQSTDFQRGALTMRAAVEDMLRAESKAMEANAEASRKVVVIGAYQAASRLLWAYANGIMDMPLPKEPTDA